MDHNDTRLYLIISGTIFGVVAAIHVLRAVNGWVFVIGSLNVPVTASWIGFLVTAALCTWAIRLVTR